MTEFHIRSLYSGSAGNSVLISACGTNILIDAGKSARTLCASLNAAGSDIGSIDAIFVTHEHSDHIGALEVISKKYRIPVHMTEASALNMSMGSFLGGAAVIHAPLYSVQVGALTVSSFQTPHDSACCVGYRVEFDGSDGCRHALGCATDIGCVTPHLREALCGCEAVVVECNHDVDMLRFGPYPGQLKTRILSRRGHLSNEDCAAFSCELAAAGARYILLAHLSRENNRPEMAYAAVRAAVPDESVSIVIADPDEPVALV